jgi:hypothetical protein
MELTWLWAECCSLVEADAGALWSRGREKVEVARSRGREKATYRGNQPKAHSSRVRSRIRIYTRWGCWMTNRVGRTIAAHGRKHKATPSGALLDV